MAILPGLISVAFFTLLERKILGVVGSRLGPYKVSLGGLLQPIGDAGKLMNKEINSLSSFNYLFYYFSSALMFCVSIFLILNLGLSPSLMNFSFMFLFIFLVLGVNSLNSILSGWSAMSKFSLLGSMRSVSQLISYEVLLFLCIFFILGVYYDFSFLEVSGFGALTLIISFPLLFLFWFFSVLAELNRVPFDFSEGESELVSGFNVEFGSFCFTLIFLAEYGMIFFFMIMTSLLFFSFNLVSSILFFTLVIWIRSMVPRYRFDKLMDLSWKTLVPQIGFLFILFFIGVSF